MPLGQRQQQVSQDANALLGLFICVLCGSQGTSEVLLVVATTCICISCLDSQLRVQVEGGDDVQQEWFLYHIAIILLLSFESDAHVCRDTKKANCFAITEIHL